MTKLYNKLPKWAKRVLCVAFLLLIAITIISVIVQIFFSKKVEAPGKISVSDMRPESVPLERPGNSAEEFSQIEALANTYSFDFLDVGNADCALLTNGEASMLIDAGDARNSKYVLAKLSKLNIKKLDVVIITNETEPHAGGLMAIIENIAVDTLIVPNVATSNDALKSCLEVAAVNGITVKQAKALDAWNVGEAQTQILSAGNNVIIRITIQAHSFLLMGDASLEEEMMLLELDMDISATILKASSRGANNTSDEMFLKMVAPEYVVISGKDETTNTQTMNRLYNEANAVYSTDGYGTISVLTNGETLNVTTEKSNCNTSLISPDRIIFMP